MPDKCLNMAGGTIIRVTELDACGNPGDCYVTSRCIATVEVTPEYVDPQDLSPTNMDGTLCWVFQTPPQLKWEVYTATLNSVDVRLWNLMTGAPVYLNEAAPTPEAVGFDTTRDQILFSNFAMELWLRDVGKPCAEGLTPYVYWIAPWLTQGRIGDRSIGNTVATFTVDQAISGVPSPWGVGPYNVERNAVTGLPRPMLTPIDVSTPGEETIARQFQTTLAPPPPSCGCQPVEPVLEVLPLLGAAAVPRTMTIPLDPNTGLPILPGRVDWDDASFTTVTSGTTVEHTYAAPGSYTVTYTPTGYSSPNYVSAEITVS